MTITSFPIATTPFSSSAFKATNGLVDRTDPDRWGKDQINVLDYGSTYDDVTIQAAIDAAFNLDISRVRIPYHPGALWTLNNPVFQDPPGNLRGSLTSAQLLAGQTASTTNHGPYISVEADWRTRFTSTFNTAPAWWVGTGGAGAAGHHVKGISLINSTGVSVNGKALPTNCTGFAIASEGSVGAVFEGCSAQNFYAGFRTAQNDMNGSLGEGNKFLYCTTGSYIGFWFYGGSGLVNTLFHCNVGAIRNFVSAGADYLVIGGEHGASQSARKACTMSSVSTLSTLADTVAGGGSFTNFTFTATISSPDVNWNVCPDGGFVYNSATIKLASFGVVPLVLTAFNQGTGVATFKIWPGWTWYHYNQEVALDTGTDFNTELQACTTVYAVERCTYAEGPGHFIGTHYESQALMALHDAPDTTAYDATFENLRINSDPANSQYDNNGNADDLGVFYGSQAFPWIRQIGNIRLINSPMPSSKVGEHVVIEGSDFGNDSDTGRLIVENCRGLFHPNLRYVSGPGSSYLPVGVGYNDSTVSKGQFGTKAFGFGEWDRTVWGPSVNANPPDTLIYDVRAGGTSTTRYCGYRPNPGEMPRLTVADVTAIASPSLNAQPTMCGGMMHQVSQIGSQLWALVKDNGGDGFSYYADLTISWSYKGQTQVVNLTGGTHIYYPFAGLEIGLDNGGGVVWYIVTGYYRKLGYMTVYRESTTASVLVGTKTVTYTGTVIKQRAPSLQHYGAPV